VRRDDVGPELGALLASRRWLLSVALGAAWGLTSIFGIAAWGETSAQEHLVLVVSGILVLAGLVLGGRSRYLWLSTIGMAVVVVSAVAAPEGSPPWIPLGAITAYAAYLTVTLCSRRVGFAVVFVGAAVLALVWSTRPSSAIPGGLAVWGGWVQVAQQIAGTLAMWWAWNTLVDEARASDRTLVELQARTAAALAVQERARLWRATATRVHESVLNSIRYVLHEGETDRVRLGQEIAREREGREATEPAVPSTLPALIEELRADEVVGARVVVRRPGPPVQLESDVFSAGRAALIEVARNSARHGGATSIAVEVRQSGPDSVAIEVTDNGSGLSATSRPGIGTTTVLDSSLEEIGGSWSLASAADGGSCVTITLPCVSAEGAVATAERTFPPFDKGRLLVTAPLAGTAAVGALYFAGLLPLGGLGPLLAVVAGVTGALAALISVVRRQRLSKRVSVLLVLAPAVVPWLLLGQTIACGEATAASRAVNIAGFSVLVIGTWGRPVTGFVGLPIWAVGTFLLATGIASDCRGFSLVALVNSVIALPLILVVTTVGARAYQRAQDRTQLERQREIAESSRAAAAMDVNAALQDSVQEALSILGEVAEGAPLDAARRRDLERVDGRIRAGIQVDPQADGAMAVLAKSLVDDVAALGVTVNVRSLVASGDQRALPLSLQHTLYRLLATPGSVPAVIQAFTDGEEDHLSVVVERAALIAADLGHGSTVEMEGVTIEVDDEPLAGEVAAGIAVLISRPIDVAIRGQGHAAVP
jgi:signal transduction histidine kinase